MTDRKQTDLLQELDRRVFMITHLLNSTKQRLSQLERSVLSSASQASSASLNRIQRVAHALEERIEEINALVASGKQSDIVRANVLAGADLVCKNDAMHKLLSEESIPPLAADKWASYVEDLFRALQQPRRKDSSGLF